MQSHNIFFTQHLPRRLRNLKKVDVWMKIGLDMTKNLFVNRFWQENLQAFRDLSEISRGGGGWGVGG